MSAMENLFYLEAQGWSVAHEVPLSLWPPVPYLGQALELRAAFAAQIQIEAAEPPQWYLEGLELSAAGVI